MLTRIAVSFSLAIVGLYGLTAPAFAAKGPDATNVMLGTGATAIILMIVIGVLYAAKWAAGLAEPAPRGPGYLPHYYSVPAYGDGHGATPVHH